MLPLPPMPVVRHESRLVFECVHCRGTVAATPAVCGLLVTCPLCGGRMTAPSLPDEPLAPSPESTPLASMNGPASFDLPPPCPPEPDAPCPVLAPPAGVTSVIAPATPARIQPAPRNRPKDRVGSPPRLPGAPPAAPAPAGNALLPAISPATRATGRSLHPETGIDRSHLDRRDSLVLLRIVAAFVVVGAICAAVVWALRAHASF